MMHVRTFKSPSSLLFIFDFCLGGCPSPLFFASHDTAIKISKDFNINLRDGLIYKNINFTVALNPRESKRTKVSSPNLLITFELQ